MRQKAVWLSIAVGAAVIVLAIGLRPVLLAQSSPQVLDPSLRVRTVVSNLDLPIGIAFLGPSDMLVLEKNTGRIKRVVNGVVTGTVLDLGVNGSSERGLLGIALHPDFPRDRGVYLYWTCRGPAPAVNRFLPAQTRCLNSDMFRADTNNMLAVPLLGNRVDRFTWRDGTLRFDRNLIMLRAFQNDGAPIPSGQDDEAEPTHGNHNGGVIRFGPDGKLYILIGDNGRRGQLQNLPNGPGGPTRDDDQFGGPEPDDAHLTGVILRLNDDGSTPADNPFFDAGARITGEAGANIQKIYAYGLRNGFGMAFDPISGALWEQENGDDSFSEINRVAPGFNSGWVQFMGPPARLAQFRAIETAAPIFGLQQLRWPPTRIAGTPSTARGRLFKLPGSQYSAPEFSWKYEVGPGGIGFVRGGGLGPQFEGDLFVAASSPALEGGHLFRFNLTNDRRAFAFADPRLRDLVADNLRKWEITESESLLIGRNFGVGTDVQAGPNGRLYIVSLTNGAVYEIAARP